MLQGMREKGAYRVMEYINIRCVAVSRTLENKVQSEHKLNHTKH